MVEITCIQCGKKFLVRNYRRDTARFCSRSCNAKYNYSNNLGNIDHSYSIGNQWRKGKKPTNAFSKGHKPWNKDKKGIHLSPTSEFKKGQKGTHWVPIGTIVTRLDKQNKLRNFIKVAEPNKWKYYYVYLYEEKYGEIPNGYVLHHKNKIPNDDRLENLEIMTRAEHINIHRKELLEAKNNKNINY